MIVRRRGASLLLAFAFVLPAVSYAENPRDFQPRQFRNVRGKTLNYRFFIPDGTPPSRLPLVIWLHDVFGAGNDNLRQISLSNTAGARVWTERANQARYPCFVVAPQCPLGAVWVNLISRTPSRKLRLVLELIDELKQDYPIDDDRLYLTGQSMGAFAVWSLLATRPGEFAGAVPVSGGGKASAARLFWHTPIWAFHGAHDPVVLALESRKMIQALREAGGVPRYTEYREVGHTTSFWQRVFQNPDLLPWLFAQKR